MQQLPLYSCSSPDGSFTCVTLAEVRQRPSAIPLVIADGLGVNSTALLIQLSRAGVRPDLILFADTGSEKPETYAYLEIRRSWLRRVGFPELIVVRRRGVRVPDLSLEDQCLRTGTLPSLAYGGKSCSLKWKVAPQDKFCNHWEPALRCWRSGQRVVKAIGYDAGPSDGRRIKEFRDQKYRLGIRCASSGWTARRVSSSSAPKVFPCPARAPASSVQRRRSTNSFSFTETILTWWNVRS